MKHKIYVKEILSRCVEVEADSLDDAFEKVEEMYKNEEIVLDDSDYTCTTAFDEAETIEIPL